MSLYHSSEFERRNQYDAMRHGIEQIFAAAQGIGATAIITNVVLGPVEVIAGVVPVDVVEGPLGINKHPIQTTFARYKTPLDEVNVHVIQNGSFLPNMTIPLTPCDTEIQAVVGDRTASMLVAFTVQAVGHTRFGPAVTNTAVETIRNRPGIYGISGGFEPIPLAE